jgi:hypothetical protein
MGPPFLPQFLEDRSINRPCIDVELAEAVRARACKINHILDRPASRFQTPDPFFAIGVWISILLQILSKQLSH